MVNWLLRLEGLSFLVIGLIVFNHFYGQWWLFALLLFTPDLSMVGYIKNPQWGARIYNIFHSYILALGLIVIGRYSNNLDWVALYGVVLVCHISLDRLLGFGLKYPTAFKDTHIQRL